MLRTNLSTRPFYNVRLVRLAIAILAVVVVVFTAFNVARVVVLTNTNSDAARRIDDAEHKAKTLREDAARVRAQIDRRELQVVAFAAREANQLIDQRTFSWTDLFNRFESTLPSDVRIVSVHPSVERDGTMSLTISVVARKAEDLDLFIENLEGTGAFHSVLSRSEATRDDGMLESVVEGRYAPPPPEAAPAPAAATPATPEARRD